MLVRLRADPSKIRVGVRRLSDGHWMATVSTIKPPFLAGRRVISESPENAVSIALEESLGFPGRDLGCEWAYPHPQKRD